jgi:hypothetical protein
MLSMAGNQVPTIACHNNTILSGVGAGSVPSSAAAPQSHQTSAAHRYLTDCQRSLRKTELPEYPPRPITARRNTDASRIASNTAPQWRVAPRSPKTAPHIVFARPPVSFRITLSSTLSLLVLDIVVGPFVFPWFCNTQNLGRQPLNLNIRQICQKFGNLT